LHLDELMPSLGFALGAARFVAPSC